MFIAMDPAHAAQEARHPQRGTGTMAIVRGNPFANDRLHGTDRSDDMYGYAGNDVLMGSAGADHIDGGFGNDTVDYSAAPNAGNYVSDTVIGGIETPFNGVLVSLIDGKGFWG